MADNKTGVRVVCPAGDIAEAQARGFSVTWPDGQSLDLIVVRRDGRYHGYRNSCPHTGVPLEWTPDQFLDASGTYLQCFTHGALFQIEDGLCVAGPCAGRYLSEVPLEIADGLLLLAG